MGEWIGRGRKARRTYGFDEIALAPGKSMLIFGKEIEEMRRILNVFVQENG